jgi:hypothetical protein
MKNIWQNGLGEYIWEEPVEAKSFGIVTYGG